MYRTTLICDVCAQEVVMDGRNQEKNAIYFRRGNFAEEDLDLCSTCMESVKKQTLKKILHDWRKEQ